MMSGPAPQATPLMCAVDMSTRGNNINKFCLLLSSAECFYVFFYFLEKLGGHAERAAPVE